MIVAKLDQPTENDDGGRALPAVSLRSGTVGEGGLVPFDHVVSPGEGGRLGVLGVWPELDGPPRLQSTSSF
jgi:hypothetical protein